MGLAAGYGPLQRSLNGTQNQNESQLLGINMAASAGQIGNYAGGAVNASPFAVQNPHPAIGPLNMNNMASGLFCYPNAGALLWIFFREGNPRFPVYFAASYGQREWQSVYRYSVNPDGTAQDTFGYKPVPTPEDGTISNSVTMKLGPAGAITSNYTVNPNNVLGDQAHTALRGPDGAHYSMNLGYTEDHSPFDRVVHTGGDEFKHTSGYYSFLAQGGMNIYCLGDHVLSVGDNGPSAQQAAIDINTTVRDVIKPLWEKQSKQYTNSHCSAPTGGGTTGGSGGTGTPPDPNNARVTITAANDDRNPNYGANFGANYGGGQSTGPTRWTPEQWTAFETAYNTERQARIDRGEDVTAFEQQYTTIEQTYKPL